MANISSNRRNDNTIASKIHDLYDHTTSHNRTLLARIDTSEAHTTTIITESHTHIEERVDQLHDDILGIGLSQGLVQQDMRRGFQTVSEQLSEGFTEMRSHFAKLSIAETTSGGQIKLDGDTARAILLPLMLLDNGGKLQDIISHLRFCHTSEISTEHLKFLSSEFTALLNSAKQHSSMPSFSAHGSESSSQCQRSRNLNEDYHQSVKGKRKANSDSGDSSEHLPKRTALPRKRKHWEFDLPIGRLHVQIENQSSYSSAIASHKSGYTLGFTFIPNVNICDQGVTTTFMKALGAIRKPCLGLKIKSFRVHEYFGGSIGARVFREIASIQPAELHRLATNGQLSIFDRLDDGVTLLAVSTERGASITC
jgi:hypothetical protein